MSKYFVGDKGKEMNGIDKLSKEECQQLVSSARKIYKRLHSAVPELSMFAVILGIKDFLQCQRNTNKEKEVSFFMAAEENLAEALKEMAIRF